MEDENINLAANAAQMQRGRPFKPGESGNPEGKKPGTKNYITQLEEAIKKYETDNPDKKLFDRLIQRAFINDNVLLNVIKKFIPDKTQNEILTPEGIKFIVERATEQPLENTDDNKENTDNTNL